MDDSEIDRILQKCADALFELSGVHAIVLGGSRARGTHIPSSDIDIGVSYDAETLDQNALNKTAQILDD